MEKWNPENITYTNSDEFKYLDGIEELINLSKETTKELNEIYDCQRYVIHLGKEKHVYDFTDIKKRLEELIKLLSDRGGA